MKKMCASQKSSRSEAKNTQSDLPALRKDVQSMIKSPFPERRVVRHFLGPYLAVFDLFGEDVAGSERPGFQQAVCCDAIDLRSNKLD